MKKDYELEIERKFNDQGSTFQELMEEIIRIIIERNSGEEN